MMVRVLSLGIVSYGSPELVAACVASVRINPPSEEHELVIVDNASSPDDVAALRGIDGVRLVEHAENVGFGGGVNRLMDEAAGDVVVVLNPDTEVVDGASLDRLAAAAREPGVALAAPVLVGASGAVDRSGYRRFPRLIDTWVTVSAPAAVLLDRVARRTTHPLTIDPTAPGAPEPTWVMGAVMAIPATAWRTVGSMDPRFFLYFEETDWQRRATAAGLRVRVVLDARVRHLTRGGDLTVMVPSPHYLDSAVAFHGRDGVPAVVVRAALVAALASSWAAFVVLSATTRVAFRGYGPTVRASRRAAVRALRHVARGRARANRPGGLPLPG